MEKGYLYNFEEKLSKLLEQDNTRINDIERKSLFYVIAGSNDLYSKVNHIYDFKDHSIKPGCLESTEVDFSSSSLKLIKLAFNLFNSYPADVMDTFYLLDDKCFKLALNAIKLRFNKSENDIFLIHN